MGRRLTGAITTGQILRIELSYGPAILDWTVS